MQFGLPAPRPPPPIPPTPTAAVPPLCEQTFKLWSGRYSSEGVSHGHALIETAPPSHFWPWEGGMQLKSPVMVRMSAEEIACVARARRVDEQPMRQFHRSFSSLPSLQWSGWATQLPVLGPPLGSVQTVQVA